MECIRSVLAEKSDKTELVISDNSLGDEVMLMVKSNFPLVRYIRRVPILSAEEHFKIILSESSAKYTIMFHDDDRIRRGFIDSMLQIIEAYPEVSAVACSGNIINEAGAVTGKKLYCAKSDLKYIKISNDLLGHYFKVIEGCTPPPFPSYLYRTKFLDPVLLSSKDGGKHADVSFLLKLLRSGPMLWSNNALIDYRIHSSNDSVSESIPDRLSLLRYAYTHEGIKPNCLMVNEYKFFYWGRWHFSKNTKKILGDGKFDRRKKIVKKFLIYFVFKLVVTRPLIVKNIAIKVFYSKILR